jgi:hypothetical protein
VKAVRSDAPPKPTARSSQIAPTGDLSRSALPYTGITRAMVPDGGPISSGSNGLNPELTSQALPRDSSNYAVGW